MRQDAGKAVPPTIERFSPLTRPCPARSCGKLLRESANGAAYCRDAQSPCWAGRAACCAALVAAPFMLRKVRSE